MARPERPTRSKRARAEARGVEVRNTEHGPVLLVDGVQRRHGVFSDGQCFLYEYAYDWTEDLEELGRRFVAYRERASAVEPGRGNA